MSLVMRTEQMKHSLAALRSRPWVPYACLAFITLLAAALRLYDLGSWSFWIDEIFTMNHARAHFSSLALILENIPPARNWIPISVILTAQNLNALGVNEWSARIASALIGMLTIPLFYKPTRRIFGDQVALVGLLLLALSPWHIYWSQNARFYTALMLFYTLALFAFHIGIEEDRPAYLFLFFALTYLAASERLTALFVFPVVLVYLAALWFLKFEKPKGLNLRNLALIALPVIVGFTIELYSQLVAGESRFFADFTWFTQHQIDDPIRLLVFIANDIGLPVMVLAAFSGAAQVIKRNRAGLLMTVSAATPLILLVAMNFFIFTKDRYSFITLYSWIVLAAIGLSEIATALKANHRWLMFGIFFVLIAHSVNDLLLYYKVNEGNHLPWKSAFSMIRERSESDDIVVAYWPEIGSYYLQDEVLAYSEVDPAAILESGKRYWFVLDSETIWINQELKSWLEENGELIEVWYLRRPEINFLRLYRFDPDRRTEP